MIENNGTTPEFQGNPESGIDQFLNQSNTTESTIEELKAKYDNYFELYNQGLATIADLETKLAEMTASKESWYQSWSDLKASIRKAEQGFRDILGGDTEASDIIESYGAVFTEHLGWEFTREFDIEITVTWRGTIELPHGVEVSDLDIDDFDICAPSHNDYNSEISEYFHYSDVSEQ